MNKIKAKITVFSASVSVLLIPATALAQEETGTQSQFETDAERGIDAASGGGGPSVPDLIQDVANILIFIVGAISVVMIIIGGLRYVLSNGDANGVNGAKNTILYAVLGLVVAIGAFAIVNFVIGSL